MRYHTWWAVCGVLLFLMLPFAGAQVDPGLREPVDVGAPVNDVALAIDSGRFAAATDDPGGTLEPPTGPEPDASTWYLWTPDGERIYQDDGVDPEECGDPASIVGGGVPDDCQTDAVALAVSADGDRLVVAGTADNDAQVVFATRKQAAIQQVSVPGSVVDVAMSDDGRQVVVVTDRGTGEGGGIHFYNWGSSVDLGWEGTASAPFSHVAISADGGSVVAGAGDVHHRYGSGGTAIADNDFPGTMTAIAIASGSDHISVAGAASGHFVLYDDDTAEDRRAFRSKHTDDPVTAVALSPDARTLALGNDEGTIWLYALDPSDYTITLLGKSGVLDPVTDLRFDGDGSVLAAATTSGISLYDTRGGLRGLWHDARATVGEVHVSRDGDTLLTGSGEDVLVYDAVHNLTSTITELPNTTLPGTSVAVEVLLGNDGNRAESVPLGVDLPSGWSAVTTPGVLDLLPGGEGNVTVRLAVPAGFAPGNVTVDLLVGGFRPVLIALTVPEHEVWRLEAGDDVQSRGTDNDGAARFTVEIHNDGNIPGTPEVVLDSDAAGWEFTLQGADDEVQPGESLEAVLVMQAPDDADELERATVGLQSGGDEPSSLEYTATVGARFDLALEAPSGHKAVGGNQSSFQVTVRNDGNTVDGVRLQLGSIPQDWNARFEGADRTRVIPLIDAGASITETVLLTPPPDVAEGPPYQITITATSLGDDTRTTTDTVLVTVEAADVEGGGDDRKIPGPALPLLTFVLGLSALRASKRKGLKPTNPR